MTRVIRVSAYGIAKIVPGNYEGANVAGMWRRHASCPRKISGESFFSSVPRGSMHVERVREIVAQHGRLGVPVSELEDEGDLYGAGLTSLATVGLMLALEDAFDIEFPDAMLSRKTFSSIASLAAAVESLTGERAGVR
jgi:acyl carrier protein